MADPIPSTVDYLHGPLVIKLADSAGASSVTIYNSDGVPVARIDSTGTLYHIGGTFQVESLTAPT